MKSESREEIVAEGKIAFVTAGGAGMFCGSCMQDNSLAFAMRDLGYDVSLLPTYTPLKLDLPSAAEPKVFLGGVNIYLNWKSPFWRKVMQTTPRFLTRWLDSPRVLNWASRMQVSNNAHELGGLAEAMLMGEQGPEKVLIEEFATYLNEQLQPEAIIFSNALLVGTLRAIRKQFRGKIYCVLQGDDLFLDSLEEPYRFHVLTQMKSRVKDFDQFFMHSQFYKTKMVAMLNLDEANCHVIPLGIDLDQHDGTPTAFCESASRQFTVGYFARIAPEKGLLELVKAFRIFHKQYPESRLLAAGNLNKEHQDYLKQVEEEAEPLGDAFRYVGSPETNQEKVAFLKSLDVFSVPAVFEEPKGLSLLEAMANGVPVVQPRRGAFPELIASTEGGLLYDTQIDDTETNNEAKSSTIETANFAAALIEMRSNERLRMQLAQAGYDNVRLKHGIKTTAQQVLQRVLQQADE